MHDQIYWLHLFFQGKNEIPFLTLYFAIDLNLWFWIRFPPCPRNNLSGILKKSWVGQVGGGWSTPWHDRPQQLYFLRDRTFLQGFLHHADVYNSCLFFTNAVENPSENTQYLPGLPPICKCCTHLCVCHLEVRERHCKDPFGNVRMLFMPLNMGFPQIKTLSL